MEAHLEMETEENVRRGMRPDEARRQALLASGGLAQAAESVREQRGLPWIESVAADLRYAVRHFRRTPLATATMVLVLSLGIGTSVVLFTVLNSIATLPAPGIARDASLVRIRGTMRAGGVAGEQRAPDVVAGGAGVRRAHGPVRRRRRARRRDRARRHGRRDVARPSP